MMTEALLLAVLAAGASLAIASWAGQALRNMLMPDMPWPGGVLDFRVAGFTLVAALTAGLVVGLLPALRASRVGTLDALKSGTRTGSWGRSRVRAALLVVQASFSVMLLVGAGVFIKSLHGALQIQTGWDVDRLVTAAIRFDDGEAHRAERRVLFPDIRVRLAALPGVDGVALSGGTPFKGPWVGLGMTMSDGSPLPERASGDMVSVSPGYFAVTGLRLLAGRDFSSDDRPDGERVLIINETMAQAIWPNETPLGKCLKMLGSCARVVGIVETAHLGQLIEPGPEAQYFLPITQMTPQDEVAIVRTTGPVSGQTVDLIRSAMRSTLPQGAYPEVRPVSDHLLDDIRPWRLGATLFSAFGVLALIVAAVGIYSSISYAVNESLHEMGIRVALGAAPARLMRMVVGSAVRVVAVGATIGLILAAQTGRLLQSLLYETTPHDPVILIAVAAVIVGVSAIASLIPAWRASRIQPIEVLRAE
jgi:predicted permease